MKREIIKIKLIDRSRFIDSKNGYRLTFKDSSHYRGYTIITESNGVYRASRNNKDFLRERTIDEIKTSIDEEIEELDKMPKKKIKKYVVWFPNDVYSGPMYLDKRGKSTFIETEAKKYDDFEQAQKKANYRRDKIDGRNWKVRTYEI